MKKNNIHVWRRTLQTAVAVFFILLPLMNAKGFKFVWGNFLNIHIGRLTFSDPLAVLQVIVNNRYLPVGLLISGGMVLGIAFFLGTVFCSWICPFGLLSELVNRIAWRRRPGKMGCRQIRETAPVVKAAVFCVGFFAVWAFFTRPALNWVSLPFQFSNIFQYAFNQRHLSVAIVFIGFLLLVEFLFRTRIWCRWMCPQSILIAVAKQFNPFGLKVIFNEKNCISGKPPFPCQKACSLDLDPRHLTFKHQVQCTNCGDCVDACRKMGKALGFKFEKR